MPSSAFQTCRSEEHTSELQSHSHLVCRLLLEKKKTKKIPSKLYHTYRASTDQSEITHFITRSALADLWMLHAPFISSLLLLFFFFFFNDTATTEIYTLSLHDALPISRLNSSHTLISYAVLGVQT